MHSAGSNASNAATLAGYSPASARSQGSYLLTNHNIRARVRELQAEWHAEQIAAIQTLAEIASGQADAKGAQARVLASCALLDRAAGSQPIQKVETNQQTAIIVQISRDDMVL
ncbi:terminase small subunit [Acidithiobacillus sulfurivorans]|uniref:Terminase small subunit n=1 Tax=Acidithiobacillus sulfurivorans TaxID=1958756 RepID=A0ABS5ZVA0_9PROT|nr:terminase small subunit [Acidithiobacillus sulfurivorans]MBU2759131.1 hypothetical protein [Acidithiobacillus sulfurivorans]